MSQSLTPGFDLIITNGDAAGELLRKAIPNTEVLPWRDVLHDGPVPLTDDGDELSEIRADYLADKGWGGHDELRDAFRARDRGIAHHQSFEHVVLWFEHDLYDQLQLIQVLDWFADNPRSGNSLMLVQADDYLGTQTPETIPDFAKRGEPVSDAQYDLAQRAWEAFRQPSPEQWAALLDQDLSALPFLQGAVKRMLEELPNARTGLSRTQTAILEQITQGVTKPGNLFGAVQKQEEDAFLGDWSFWERLDGLARDDAPLITGFANGCHYPGMEEDEFKTYLNSELAVTDLGERILSGADDYAQLARIDCWFGGTHQTNDALWRWNRETGQLVAPV